MTRNVSSVDTELLRIAYEDSGPRDGPPLVLLHGWPDHLRSWDRVAADAARGRVPAPSVPNLRGFLTTAFRDPGIMRSGQLSALGQDLLDFAGALGLGGVQAGARAADFDGAAAGGGRADVDVLAEGVADDADQVLVVDRLGHDIRGARLHGRNRGVDLRPVLDHEDGRSHAQRLDAAQQREPVMLVAKVEIGDDHIGAPPFEAGKETHQF